MRIVLPEPKGYVANANSFIGMRHEEIGDKAWLEERERRVAELAAQHDLMVDPFIEGLDWEHPPLRLSEVAKKLNVPVAVVTKAVMKPTYLKKMRFVQLGKEWRGRAAVSVDYKSKPVVCDATGQRWASAKDCAKDLGVSRSNVCDAIKIGRRAGRRGLFLRYESEPQKYLPMYEKNPPAPYEKTKASARFRTVILSDRGERWIGYQHAAEALGCSRYTVETAVQGKCRCRGRIIWREGQEKPVLPEVQAKPVVRVSDGQWFASVSKATGLQRGHPLYCSELMKLSRAIKQKKPYRGEYWDYATSRQYAA